MARRPVPKQQKEGPAPAEVSFDHRPRRQVRRSSLWSSPGRRRPQPV